MNELNDYGIWYFENNQIYSSYMEEIWDHYEKKIL